MGVSRCGVRAVLLGSTRPSERSPLNAGVLLADKLRFINFRTRSGGRGWGWERQLHVRRSRGAYA
eukprot:3827685-Lingulodinium_polyedra.AAC.1